MLRSLQLNSSRHPGSTRGGCLAKLFFGFLLLGLVFCLAWVFLLPGFVASTIQSRTGFPVKVESLSLNPFTARFSTTQFVITNPEGFSIPDFVHIKELTGEVELSSLFKDRLIVDEAVIDIEKIALVKNSKGERNGVLFQERLIGTEGKTETTSKAKEPETAASGKSKEFLIKKLRVRLGKIAIVDGLGNDLKSHEYAINFDQSFQDVSSPTDVVKPILMNLLSNGAAIGDYAGKLGKEALESLKQGGQSLKETGKQAGQTLKGIFQSLGDKVNGK